MNTIPPQGPLLATLGTAVIDELHFKDGTCIKEAIGGSGVWAALGARLFLPEPSSSLICGTLHVGMDFPVSAEHIIRSWKTSLELRHNAKRHTTSNIVTFLDKSMEKRTRQYRHNSIFTEPADLPLRALDARVFHLICSPDKLRDQIVGICDLRTKDIDKAIFIWEPWPKSCKVENLDYLKDTIKLVDVVSPNHVELMDFFLYEPQEFSKELIETLAEECVRSGIGNNGEGALIVRCGEHGSLFATAGPRNIVTTQLESVSKAWLPAYHTDPAKVACTNGAGNAFLGGLAVGYSETNDWSKACLYGAVAAAFVVEQIAAPVRTGKGATELWNGDVVRNRLRELSERVREQGA